MAPKRKPPKSRFRPRKNIWGKLLQAGRGGRRQMLHTGVCGHTEPGTVPAVCFKCANPMHWPVAMER